MNKKYFFSHRVLAMLLTLTLCLSVCMTNALAGGIPSPQCRLRAEDFAAAPQERRAICPEKHT